MGRLALGQMFLQAVDQGADDLAMKTVRHANALKISVIKFEERVAENRVLDEAISVGLIRRPKLRNGIGNHIRGPLSWSK